MANEAAIQAALRALETRQFTKIRAAARAFNVSHVTLSRRRKGQLSHAEAASGQQALSPEQEGMLVRWILEAESAGHAFNHVQLKEMAALISGSSGGPGHIGKHWIVRFLKRHPALRTKRGRPIDNTRVSGLYSTTFTAWFERLLALIKVYSIKTDNFWNFDETGLALGISTNQRVIGGTQSTSTFVRRSDNRQWVTILECISSGGQTCTPLVIFKGKNVQQQWFDDENVPKWFFTCTQTAYINAAVAVKWLLQIFIPKAACTDKYTLLLLDGHKTHTSLEFMYECFKKKIIPYYLVPHASHFTQPLDISCFSPLKQFYRAEINKYCQLNETAEVRKQHFIRFYQNAREKAFSLPNIKSGWKAAGIVPWEPKKVLKSSFIVQIKPKVRPATPEIREPEPWILQTPTNRETLRQSIRATVRDTPIDRTVRKLLRKTEYGFDRLYNELARTQQALNDANVQLDNYRMRGKQRKNVDPNDEFAAQVIFWTADSSTGPTTTTSAAPATTMANTEDSSDDSDSAEVAFGRVAAQLNTIRQLQI